MGKKDLYQSDFYDDNSRFADVFNGVLFEGKEVIKPKELEEVDSVLVSLSQKSQGKKVICDKVRKWKGRYISIMVLENQSYVDYGMVFRVMESEVIGYGKQRKDRFREKYKKQKLRFNKNEYLSQMKKNEKFIPIITLVLYLGKDKVWDGEKSLYGMLELEEEVKPYVNDFKINLFDYHECENFDVFKTENRFLFEMLSVGKDKKKMLDLLKKQKEYEKLDKESAKAILGIVGVKADLESIKIIDDTGEEKYNMCKAIEDIKRDERRAGKREGRREGRREGKCEGELVMALRSVKNLMKNQKVSCEEAMKMMGIPRNMCEKIQEMV